MDEISFQDNTEFRNYFTRVLFSTSIYAKQQKFE